MFYATPKPLSPIFEKHAISWQIPRRSWNQKNHRSHVTSRLSFVYLIDFIDNIHTLVTRHTSHDMAVMSKLTHVTRHLSRVTRVSRDTSHVTRHTSHITSDLVTTCASHDVRHTFRVTCCTSHTWQAHVTSCYVVMSMERLCYDNLSIQWDGQQHVTVFHPIGWTMLRNYVHLGGVGNVT